jgi:hypothetical protein
MEAVKGSCSRTVIDIFNAIVGYRAAPATQPPPHSKINGRQNSTAAVVKAR